MNTIQRLQKPQWQKYEQGQAIDAPDGAWVMYTDGQSYWGHHYSNNATHYLILPPLPREPRRMSVWAWREFPDVSFTLYGRKEEYWWMSLPGGDATLTYSVDGKPSGQSVLSRLSILESEGEEVVE